MLIIALLMLAAAVADADHAAPAAAFPTYDCARAATTRPIVIDGRLDEPDWGEAAWTEKFVALNGGDAPPRTRAKFLSDARHLYVAAEMAETDVWAAMTKHDAPLYRENAIELFMDPDDDGENYLELELNPLNTTFDLLMSRPYARRGKGDGTWEIKELQTAVHVDGTLNDPGDEDRAWTVEIAIPWPALKAITGDGPLPPAVGARWLVNLARVIVARGEEKHARHATWSPIDDRSLHVPQRWGWLNFKAARSRTPDPASTRPAPAPQSR